MSWILFERCPGFALGADERQTPGTLPASLAMKLKPEIQALPPKSSYGKSSKQVERQKEKDQKEKKEKKLKKKEKKRKNKETTD